MSKVDSKERVIKLVFKSIWLATEQMYAGRNFKSYDVETEKALEEKLLVMPDGL